MASPECGICHRNLEDHNRAEAKVEPSQRHPFQTLDTLRRQVERDRAKQLQETLT